MTRIQEHLRRLGVGIHLKGYRATVEAVSLAIEDEDRLQCAQEALFKPIAVKLRCDFRCVERNIRTVIDRAWRCNPTYLFHLAGYHLDAPPTVIEFLDILVAFALRELAEASA